MRLSSENATPASAPASFVLQILRQLRPRLRRDQQVLDRFQLFRALQMQDRTPGVRLGEAAAALGYAPIGAIERLFARFQQLQTVTVD